MPQPKNRRFVAQRKKEQRQKRIIIIATAAVLVVVLGLVGYGVFELRYLQPKQTVVEVESRTVNVTEFKERVRYQRFQMINQAIQMVQMQQSMGQNPQVAGYFQQQLMQIYQQLNQPNSIGQQVVNSLRDELIILEEAEKRGIELSEEEFEQELQGIFGYYPEGTPTPQPTWTPLATSTLTSQQLTLVPDTPTPTASEEGDDGPTPTPTTAPESSSDPTATPMIQPTEYTFDLYQENYQQWIDNLKSEADISEDTFRRLVRIYLIRDRVRDEVTADVERTQEQVWARHILVEDEETAQEVLSKLDEGQSFADLAAEYSSDSGNKDRGGSLGWFARGSMVPAFEESAFALDVGDISEPVETQFGWHVIQVLGHEERPVSQNAYQQMKEQAFTDWLAEKREEYQVEIAENWQKYVPSSPDLPAQVQQLISQMQQQMQQQQQQIQPGVPSATPSP